MTDALLASILDRPEDDLPRLVFADWLDKNGEHDRSEFIRVGCELARSIAVEKCGECGAIRGAHAHANNCSVNTLIERHRELLGPWKPGSYGENQFKWFVDNPVGRVLYAAEYAGPTIRRGFIESVRLPLAEFMGESECPHCDHGVQWRPMPPDSRACEECGGDSANNKPGTGRTKGIAAALFRSQPITRVEFIGAEPYEEEEMPDAGFRWDGDRDYFENNAGGGTPTCAEGGLPNIDRLPIVIAPRGWGVARAHGCSDGMPTSRSMACS